MCIFIFLLKKLGFPNKWGDTVKEYKFNNATVRIYGSCDQDNLKAATEAFMKKVERKKKNEKKSIEKSA